jgi:2-dehydro-3-deoxyphosphogluconate aldolase/(4S)-4-hydroxy-2-oxoglutarate aldolase
MVQALAMTVQGSDRKNNDDNRRGGQQNLPIKEVYMKYSKQIVLETIEREGLVGIVRDKNEKDALTRTRALIAGGVKILEISLATPGALNIITEIAKEADETKNGVCVGVGTALDSESARISILAGAKFVIAPNFSPELAKTCNRYGVVCLPGVATFTEIVNAMEYGIDLVKLFPGETIGPKFIKAVKAPLPQANIVPVGGVSYDNIDEWFAAGAYAVALGSGITHPDKKTCVFDEIKANAEKIVKKVKEVKE